MRQSLHNNLNDLFHAARTEAGAQPDLLSGGGAEQLLRTTVVQSVPVTHTIGQQLYQRLLSTPLRLGTTVMTTASLVTIGAIALGTFASSSPTVTNSPRANASPAVSNNVAAPYTALADRTAVHPSHRGLAPQLPPDPPPLMVTLDQPPIKIRLSLSTPSADSFKPIEMSPDQLARLGVTLKPDGSIVCSQKSQTTGKVQTVYFDTRGLMGGYKLTPEEEASVPTTSVVPHVVTTVSGLQKFFAFGFDKNGNTNMSLFFERGDSVAGSHQSVSVSVSQSDEPNTKSIRKQVSIINTGTPTSNSVDPKANRFSMKMMRSGSICDSTHPLANSKRIIVTDNGSGPRISINGDSVNTSIEVNAFGNDPINDMDDQEISIASDGIGMNLSDSDIARHMPMVEALIHHGTDSLHQNIARMVRRLSTQFGDTNMHGRAKMMVKIISTDGDSVSSTPDGKRFIRRNVNVRVNAPAIDSLLKSIDIEKEINNTIADGNRGGSIGLATLQPDTEATYSVLRTAVDTSAHAPFPSNEERFRQYSGDKFKWADLIPVLVRNTTADGKPHELIFWYDAVPEVTNLLPHSSAPYTMPKADHIALSVYPNPTPGATTIHYDMKGAKSAEFSIHNLLGAKMMDGGTTSGLSGDVKLDLSSLDAGVYLLITVTDDGQRDVERIIVTK